MWDWTPESVATQIWGDVGMEASGAQRLRELEAENAKLKKLLAEAHLDMHALKSVLGVKR